jgi:hypothetical protein
MNVPDGVAVAPDGTLCISCYAPIRAYLYRAGGPLEMLIEDRAASGPTPAELR